MKSDDIPLSTFESAMQQFDAAAELLNLDPGLLEVIKKPRRSIVLELPVTLDDGTLAPVSRVPRAALGGAGAGEGGNPLPPGGDAR